MLVAPLWGFSLSLCVSPSLAYTRPGACVSVLTEPQTHLSRCFVASTLVHAPPQPCAHLLPPLPPPNSSHLAHSQANLAVDVRGKPAIGEMGGVEALLQVPPHGKGGGGGHQARRRFAPLPLLLYRRTHCSVPPTLHHAMYCIPPRQVLPDADPDAAAQITRCLANLLLDDACRSRVVAHEGGLRLLLQQARHRWGRGGGEAVGPSALTLTLTLTPSFSSYRWQAPTRQCRSLRCGGALEPRPLAPRA